MNKFEKKRCRFSTYLHFASFLLFSLVTKQNDYQIQSGAKITCAKFGGQNYQLMAAGDDQKNIYLWKLSKNLHKFVSKGELICE